MSFRLCNATTTFQFFINEVLQDLVDACVIMYIDYSLLYCQNMTDHITHVQTVLQRYSEHDREEDGLLTCGIGSPVLETFIDSHA